MDLFYPYAYLQAIDLLAIGFLILLIGVPIGVLIGKERYP